MTYIKHQQTSRNEYLESFQFSENQIDDAIIEEVIPGMKLS